jgi:hypothetical protein
MVRMDCRATWMPGSYGAWQGARLWASCLRSRNELMPIRKLSIIHSDIGRRPRHAGIARWCAAASIVPTAFTRNFHLFDPRFAFHAREDGD